jgi:hypothetical protein
MQPVSISLILVYMKLYCRLNPIPYCRLKNINIDIFQRFELNAIPGYARLAEFFSICLG